MDNNYIDYRELLFKYMDHVRQCEGIDFTDRLNDRTASDVFFFENEISDLLKLSLNN